MKETVNLFKKHRTTIENYLVSIIESNNIASASNSEAERLLKIFGSLQTIYSVDNFFKQTTPSYYRKFKDDTRNGADKSRYFSNVELSTKQTYMTNPYLHHRSGRSSVTFVKKVGGNYIVYDFDLLLLLEELHLIEFNGKFDKMNRFVYGIGGLLLSIVSIFLILYGGYAFINVFFVTDIFILNEIFIAIIAITLGLAIYDLAKTILEYEVFFRTLHTENLRQYRILGKFLSSIIIALSIESLMVVFKIALEDHTQMIYAVYLIVGVTLMIVALAIFYYFTQIKAAELIGKQ